MIKMMKSMLQEMVRRNASDLYLSVDAPPSLKVEGKISPISSKRLDECQVPVLIDSVLEEADQVRLENKRELDKALLVEGVGRFRVNAYFQRGYPALVVRHVREKIPSIDALGLPDVLEKLAVEQAGLVVVAGNTGAGKSTTLASMINHRNRTQYNHILTVEEPIEYWHTNYKSFVDQREVGTDTLSYESALKHAMREDPDVIMVGETRDYDALKHVISFADSGHLCMTTMHAHSTAQVLQRMQNFFPESASRELLMSLSVNLKAVICQRLIPGVDGKRVLAYELLLNTPLIAELIRNNKLADIPEALDKTSESGCVPMDRSLFELFTHGQITEETAMQHASSRTNLRLEMKQMTAGRPAYIA